MDTAQRIVDLEMALLPSAVRIDGRVEKGIGSPFQNLSREAKEHLAALDALLPAETAAAAANAALADAKLKVSTTAKALREKLKTCR